MRDQTKRVLIEEGSGAVAALVRDMITHRNDMSKMEQQKDLELELAKARDGARADAGQASEGEAALRQQVGGADLGGEIEDLKTREDCSICRQLLDAIKRADHSVQVRALTEYGKLKRAVETGASEAEIKEVLETSETLADLLEQEMRG